MLHRLLLGILLMFSVGVVSAQTSTPQITTFTSHVNSVDRTQLSSGNTYVLVTWRVDDRPANTNLIFEQVLPDGTLLNIELPRLFWWVNSAGIGFVNLIYPGHDFNTITLRLSVINNASDVLAYRELQIQIEDNLTRPQIDSFYATSVDGVSLAQLQRGEARIEVGWFTSNRTEQMNLVFEQVLPNGQLINVELPRPHPWVNSEGTGITAPIYPGDAVAHVHLQVRLYWLNSGETIDTRTIFVPIREHIQVAGPTPTLSTTEPVINRFEVTPALASEGDSLSLSWDVSGLNMVSIAVSIPNASQPIQQYLNQSNIGTMTVNAPLGVQEAIFLMYANDTLRNPIHSITISLNCRFSWIDGHNHEWYCPESQPQTAQAAYQAFERGYMIWREDTDMIWVYSSQLDTYLVRPDTYAGGEILFEEMPPSGLYQPINGFGKVWVEDASIRQQLGWAISAEQGYTMTYQQSMTGDGTRIRRFNIFTLPDGTRISAMIDSF
ncbi:MAG: hypothetical protein KJ043_03360 [Anaerolineae bacterium]|nr:hypothetical protein [Anaerolineae bacterium]